MATTSTNGGGAGGLPDDVVSDLLSAPRRRRVLDLLVEASGSMAVDDLAALILAGERDTDQQSVPLADKKQVRTELYETHLPKLTATGVVTFDSQLGVVRLERDIREA